MNLMEHRTVPQSHYAGRVAFQGEPGAFSEEAALRLLGSNINTVPCPTFDALFAATATGQADAILVPIENTLAGTIARACDLLWECPLFIAAETVHRIKHCLIGNPGATLQTLRAVQSHPAALAQCETFFREHPHLRRIAAEDTAGSVRDIMASADPTRAAIASRRAAEIYRATVLLEAIEDDPENYTRFLLLTSEAAQNTGANKLTLLAAIAHRPGSLHRALAIFAERGMNLLKIESRPLVGKPWHYRFFLDVETSSDPAQVDAVLRALHSECESLRRLGWYRAALAGAGTSAPVGSRAPGVGGVQ